MTDCGVDLYTTCYWRQRENLGPSTWRGESRAAHGNNAILEQLLSAPILLFSGWRPSVTAIFVSRSASDLRLVRRLIECGLVFVSTPSVFMTGGKRSHWDEIDRGWLLLFSS